MAKAVHTIKLPKRDMRHIFACLAATGNNWIVYRRDARGWDEAEPRAGIREILDHGLRDALQFSRDFTPYGCFLPLEKLDDPDVPLRCGAVAYSHMMMRGASPAEAIILGQAATRHLAAAGQIDAAAQLRQRNDRGSD